jgi:hypothetical protein
MLNDPDGSVRYGPPPGASHGIDTDQQGAGTVTEHRPCQLIRQPKPIADRQFEIAFLGLAWSLGSHSVDRLRKCKWRFPNG